MPFTQRLLNLSSPTPVSSMEGVFEEIADKLAWRDGTFKPVHEFVVRGVDCTEKDFLKLVRGIRWYGYDDDLAKQRYRFLEMGGKRYWTTGYDIRETTRIFRAELEGSRRMPPSEDRQEFFAKPWPPKNERHLSRFVDPDEKTELRKVFMGDEDIRSLVSVAGWKFAKSMPKHPHEYMIIGKTVPTEWYSEFQQFGWHLSVNGYTRWFFRKPIHYIDLDGFCYWHMGEAKQGGYDLINRAALPNTSSPFPGLSPSKDWCV